MKIYSILSIASMGMTGSVLAQEAAPIEAVLEEQVTDNLDLKLLFEMDQAVRKNPAEADWKIVERDDAARRTSVKKMLETGELRTARDFRHAAFIFQHGNRPNDFLLAHVLATTAVSLGYDDAKWISAATLDRYLHSIDQPQIFGTQYRWSAQEGSSMGKYDKKLLSDTLRAEFGVRPIEAQKSFLAGLVAREAVAAENATKKATSESE